MSQAITIDIAGAIAQLEQHPEMTSRLNELVFGKIAADQLAVREELIIQIGEALHHLTAEAKADGMQSRAGWDCWISNAEKALASYHDYVGAGRVSA